jgi:hypothetical protein
LAQEEAIVQEWERRKAVEPDLANLVSEEGDEPFFIKALEKCKVTKGISSSYLLATTGSKQSDFHELWSN